MYSLMEQTPFLVFMNLLNYTLIVIGLMSVMLKGGFKSKLNRQFVFILLLLFVIYPFYSGDFFHYAEGFSVFKKGFTDYKEPVYQFLMDISPSYSIFRMIVWGVSYLIFIRIVQNLKIHFDVALLFFSFLYLLYFSYGRVTASMVIMYLGLSLITVYPHRHNYVRLIIGFILVGTSYYFHKTALFGIAVVIVSLLIYNLNRKRLLLLLLFIPVSLGTIGAFLANIMDMSAVPDSGVIDVFVAQKYMKGEASGGFDMGAGISNFMMRTSFYIFLYIYIYSIFKGKYSQIPCQIKVFGTAAFLCVVGASVFAFDFGVNTYVLYYRFLNFAMIPATIFLSYIYSAGYCGKSLKMCLLVGVTGSFYTIIYSFYCAYVGK